MDLEGNLSVFEPIAIFQLMNLAESTGELIIDIGGNSARLFFDRGSVNYAEISNRRVKLGEYLVKTGAVGQKDLDKCLVKNRKGKRLGEVLVESGVITESNLRDAISEQIKEVVYEVVRWKKGWFSFAGGRRPTSQDVFIDVPLDSLILEGLKRLDEEREGAC